jgi:hypothetical protein
MSRGRRRTRVANWGIPALYAAFAVAAGLALPRLELRWFPGSQSGLSAAATAADLLDDRVGDDRAHGDRLLARVRDGAVQRDRLLAASRAVARARPGALARRRSFCATFLYAVAAMAWIDRGGSRPPLIATWLVIAL